jgi:hypothetical protein
MLLRPRLAALPVLPHAAMDRSIVDGPGALLPTRRDLPSFGGGGLNPLKPAGGGNMGPSMLKPMATMHQTGLTPQLLAVRISCSSRPAAPLHRTAAPASPTHAAVRAPCAAVPAAVFSN